MNRIVMLFGLFLVLSFGSFPTQAETLKITINSQDNGTIYGKATGVGDYFGGYCVSAYFKDERGNWGLNWYRQNDSFDVHIDGSWSVDYEDVRISDIIVFLMTRDVTAPNTYGPNLPTVPGASASDRRSFVSLPVGQPPIPVPTLVISGTPEYGTGWGWISGHLTGVGDNPAYYVIANYIMVGDNWWTKPTFANPTVPVDKNGGWYAAMSPSGNDAWATKIYSVAIPAGVSPPLLSGATTIPAIPQAVATAELWFGPTPRTLSFSGYNWLVKRRDFRYDPGPCLYMDDSAHVWLDSSGYLHLTAKWENNQPIATEVICQNSKGYGYYIYTTKCRLDQLDPFAVFGSFMYDIYAAPPFREIDIEAATWNTAPDGTFAQFVVQPVTDPWHSSRAVRYGFTLTNTACDLTNVIHWQAGKVTFQTFYGKYLDHQPPGSRLVKSWTFSDSSVPTPGTEQFRFNLWLLGGSQPAKNQEVVITGFKYSSKPLPVQESSADGIWSRYQ